MLTKLNHAGGDSADSENPVRPSISALVFVCVPFAIFFRVSKIVFNSLQCQAGRFFAHILHKIFKAVQPAVTNGDPSPAIIFPTLAFLIPAPTIHLNPSSVCAPNFTISGISMRYQRTTARLGFSSCQIVNRNNRFFPAVAEADTGTSAGYSFRTCVNNHRRFTDHFKACKFLSDGARCFLRHGSGNGIVMLVAGVRLNTGTRYAHSNPILT